MSQLTEGERATLWVLGAMHDLVSAGLAVGPKLLTAKGCSAYDQIDAGRHSLDQELVAERISYHLRETFEVPSEELDALSSVLLGYYKLDRELFHASYKPADPPPPGDL